MVTTDTIAGILDLVGSLDDKPGDDSGRERFRRYLDRQVRDVGTLRDFTEACYSPKARPDEEKRQYDRALQDLINHAGRLMGFDVVFGRYAGVSNDIGHDGLWRHKGLSIVVEVKTTDAYVIKTGTLLSYISNLVSEGVIEDEDHALGLYVVGRQDREFEQLEHAIVAGKYHRRLRLSTVESILSLTELVVGELINLDEAVSIVRPTGILIDDTVTLLARVAGQSESTTPEPPVAAPTLAPATESAAAPAASPALAPMAASSHTPPKGPNERHFFITPVKDEKEFTAVETIQELLGQGAYVFGESTPGRKAIKPDDRICFYHTGVGVVASARVAGPIGPRAVPGVKHPDKFPLAFDVDEVRYFFDEPVVIDAALRAKMDAFRGKDPSKGWAWLVQSTGFLTAHDYALLTGQDI